MTTNDIFAGATPTELRDEKARKAVKVFRAMQPGLTAYARAITGRRDVSVELSEGSPRTDGKKIYVRPPIALGDMTPHERIICDKREKITLQLLCPACRVREDVLITVYHEIDHIAYGSFGEPTEFDRKEILEQSLDEFDSKYAEHIRQRVRNAPYSATRSYLGLSSLVSGFLPIIVNSLEDARVDSEMFKARPGTKVMFDAFCQKIFSQGVEQADHSIKKWSEYPLNSQAMIGIFVLACGYTYEGWFHPQVEEMLGDKPLRELVSRIEMARSVQEAYKLGFPILARLRELGFCRLPDEPEEEAPEEPEEEEEEQPDDSDEPEESDDDEDASEEGDSSGDEPSDDPQTGQGEESSPEQGDGPSEPSQDDDPEQSEPSGGESDGSEDDSGGSEGESPEDAEGSSDGADSNEVEDVDDQNGGSDGSDSEEAGQADDDGDSDTDSDVSGSPVADDEGVSGDENNQYSSEESSEPSGGSDPEESEEAGESDSVSDEEAEALDSGADDGQGGETVEEVEYGNADDVLKDVQVFGKHDVEIGDPPEGETAEETEAVEKAIVQSLYFESPSMNVNGVKIFRRDKDTDIPNAWNLYEVADKEDKVRGGIDCDVTIPEQILGPALLQTRKTFSDNKRAKMEHNLRAGRINTRVLGKRAPLKDDRLFQKKTQPGKLSYAVILGVDISGSTIGVNIALAKRAVMAQAELCSRVGVDFAIYAHSTSGANWFGGGDMGMYEVKSFDEPWANDQREALAKLGSWEGNLDGHAAEFLRKTVERQVATDKIILYYSDGKMPAMNHDEELEVLQREIAYCKSKNITLLGVGIRTDSPSRHGLDTVQVDDDEDLVKVVHHLEKVLLRVR